MQVHIHVQERILTDHIHAGIKGYLHIYIHIYISEHVLRCNFIYVCVYVCVCMHVQVRTFLLEPKSLSSVRAKDGITT